MSLRGQTRPLQCIRRPFGRGRLTPEIPDTETAVATEGRSVPILLQKSVKNFRIVSRRTPVRPVFCCSLQSERQP
jgi:hypothetical protein